jgi:hypothetical protein
MKTSAIHLSTLYSDGLRVFRREGDDSSGLAGRNFRSVVLYTEGHTQRNFS